MSDGMFLDDTVLGRRLTTHRLILSRLVFGYSVAQLAIRSSMTHPSYELGQQFHLVPSQRLVAFQLTLIAAAIVVAVFLFAGDSKRQGRLVRVVVMTTEQVVSQSGQIFLVRSSEILVTVHIQEQTHAENRDD